MRIESIKIHNHRQLRDVAIRFPKSDSKNDLHIILAENGVGKTNVLNAITWCLYNKEMHLRDSKNAVEIPNSQVVEETRQFGGGDVDVTVELVISTENTSKITFKRTGIFHVSKDAVIPIKDKLSVSYQEDGGYRIVEDEDETRQLVHEYLPEEINNYIFFDGEQLEKFFSTDQLTNVRNGINDLTQASHLKAASEYLERYVKENITPKISNSGDKEVREQQQKVDELHAQIELSEQTIRTCIEQIEECENKISELNNVIHGCDNVREKAAELQRSEQRLNELDKELNDKDKELMKFAREYFTLFSLYPSVKRFHDYIEMQRKNGNLPPMIDKEILEKILANKKCVVCGQEHLTDDNIAFVEHLKKTLAVASETSNELSSAYGAMSAYFKDVNSYSSHKNKLIKERSSISNKIEEEQENYRKIDTFLRSIPDNKEIAKALDYREQYMSQRDNLIGKKATEEEAKKRNERTLESEDKKLRELVAKQDSLKELVRKRDFCETCIKIMKESTQEVLDECRKAIQDETFRIFDELIWKQGDFTKIEILENYSFRLLDRYGNQTLGSCSAAETSLLALSFTLALQEVSKHDSLLFIDTPIGRVGTQNRKNFMNILLNVASQKQVILTFTPTEYDDNVQKILAGQINSFNTLSMKDGITNLNK
jgi:DNA sulfur modification protein DndD